MDRFSRGRLSALLLVVAFVVGPATWTGAAQDERGFIDRVYRDADGGEHKYVVFLPHDYMVDAGAPGWPVILFLHGAGERGTDGKRQVEVGLGKAIRAREKTFPFIAVFPQCEDRQAQARRAWNPETADGKRALAMLAEVEKTYRTDKERVYLTGLSMGGFGTWTHAAADPARWAAIVPICGGGDTKLAEKIARLPVWCFHGADDRVVPPDESRKMIEALKKAGATPKYTEYPGVGHNSWDSAYATDELYTWLLEHKRNVGGSERPRTTPAAAPNRQAATADEAPFVPALDIPRAVFVRLGKEMLDALADSVPHVVPPDALSGTLADARQTTSSEGMTFTVQLRGISYRAKLTRAIIEPAAGRLTVTLNLRDVNLVINRTQVSGEGRSATCGPMRIVLGARADLPIAFDVEPVVAQRRVKLKLLDTRFRLPRDNWNVGRPEWVSVQGLGMTEERVVSGLRDGFYSNPGRIEREVMGAVPRMMDRLEEQFGLAEVDRVAAELWPLPVYKPRIRTWPSEVRTDAGGVTLVLGVSVAALEGEQLRAGPKIVELPGSDIADAIKGEQLQVGLAPDLMGPLSAQLVEADVARVLVLDTPMKSLAALADTKTLGEIVPDLKERRPAEVRSELVLTGPLHMRRINAESAAALELEFPKVLCSIALPGEPGGKSWTPYLDIEFRLRQVARPEVMQPTRSTRVLALGWQGDATIEVAPRFAAGYTPKNRTIDAERIRQILAAGWREWTESGPLAKVPFEDIDLGFARLRAQRAGWEQAFLTATFAPAGIVIQNRMAEPIAYEMKGPYSAWGGPYTLEPEKNHSYGIAYPVTCRFRVKGREKTYTLPAGSAFEFQAGDQGEIDLYASRDEPPAEAHSTSLETERH